MKKILIIDDEPDFCYFVKKGLEATGDYEVITTYDGRSGVKLAKAVMPDFILLDVMMPGLSGTEIAAILKGDSVTAEIPVSFLTALVQEDETSKGRSLIGGYHFIAKPVKLSVLITVIEKFTSGK